MDGGLIKKHSITIINIILFTIVMIANLFDQIQNGQSIIGRSIYTLPFLILIILCTIFRKKYKFNAYLFLIMSFLSLMTTREPGNLTGLIFLVYSLYIFQTFKMNIIIIIATSIGLASKIFFGFTPMQVFSTSLGYVYCILIYYILIHPKPKKITEVSDIPDDMKQIFNLMMKGKNNKEIAAEIIQYDYSQDVIRKKIKIFIDKLGLSGVPELFVYLNEKGHIEKNWEL